MRIGDFIGCVSNAIGGTMNSITTPLFFALPLLAMACQEDTSESDPTLDGLTFMDEPLDINIPDTTSTGLSPKSPDIGHKLSDLFSGVGEGEPEEELTPSSSTLHCSTAAYHYDFDGVPESVRVQLYRDADEVGFDYQDQSVHPDDSLGPVGLGPIIVADPASSSGIALGAWSDTTLSLTLPLFTKEAPSSSTNFWMELVRDEATPGTVYRGVGYVAVGFGVEMTCWDPEIEPEFLYEPETGRCSSDDGVIGMNPWPIHMVRETGDGECADLSHTMLNEDDYGYPSLELWNLRGANLDGATLHFANLLGADLEGTDMSELEYGYAVISGSTDDYTQQPRIGCGPRYGVDLYCKN
jgi:hypothetical protein